jgi:hypothetical protein
MLSQHMVCMSGYVMKDSFHDLKSILLRRSKKNLFVWWEARSIGLDEEHNDDDEEILFDFYYLWNHEGLYKDYTD